MNKPIKWILALIIVAVSFAANPHGPLGGFWRPDSTSPTPTSLQLPFFLVLNIIESVSFAYAVVILTFNFPKKAYSSLTLWQTRIAFICLIWFLGNWWAHDSLHIHNGMYLQGLLYIEYGFHVSMIFAASYLLWVANRLLRTKT